MVVEGGQDEVEGMVRVYLNFGFYFKVLHFLWENPSVAPFPGNHLSGQLFQAVRSGVWKAFANG